MSGIQFRFGLSFDGRPVSIKDAVKGKEYTCVNCGKPLIAKQGTKREWHFAHKSNTSNCSFETYLHKLSKYFIKEMFKEKETLTAYRWVQKGVCDRSHVCPFKKDAQCYIFEKQHIDLLQYDNCVEEAAIGGFVADLLFTSDELEPILIEICVTHPCTKEKKESGLKIIEIHVESEADVENLLLGRLIENEKTIFYNFHDAAPQLRTDNCMGHHVYHGYSRRFCNINGNLPYFEEEIVLCKDVFWPNPEYSWEMYAENHTRTAFLTFEDYRRNSSCNSCYWLRPQRFVGEGICNFDHRHVYNIQKSCSHHLLKNEGPSVCHINWKSYVYHPEYQRPQKLIIHNE